MRIGRAGCGDGTRVKFQRAIDYNWERGMGISFIDTNERRGETQLDLPPGMGFVGYGLRGSPPMSGQREIRLIT